MTEILEDNFLLEQELHTHYQQEYGPLLASAEMWTRVSPLLKQQQAQLWNRRLLASLRTLFSSSGSLERVGSPRGGIRVPRPVTIVMASMACFIVLSGFAFAALGIGPELQRLFNLDPGAKQLSLEQQFTQYNQTQKVDGHTITLSAAYADANNVIVAYQSDLPLWSAANQDSLRPDGELSTSNGQPLRMTQGLVNNTTLQEKLSAHLFTFDGSTIKGNPHSLALTLTLFYGNLHAHNWHTATFHFTIPFHQGRTLALHQSVYANGEALTLDHVVITPSETRFYLSGDANFQNHWETAVLAPYISSSLYVGKQSYNPEQIQPEKIQVNNVPIFHGVSGGGIPTSPTDLRLPYTLPATAQHGNWTLTVQISFPDCSNKNTAPYCTAAPTQHANDWYKYLAHSPAEIRTFHIHA